MTKRAMLNEALKLARLYWGYSQSELSEVIGVSQSMLSEIERGQKTVSMDLLEKYSSGLGVRMSQLLFFAEEIEDQPPIKKGRLVVASQVLRLLEALKPDEPGDRASA